MAEPSVGTPGSTAESGTPAKSLAVKDRACQYCNTYFTSSSLGRHLDLYIKEKNPKPPDGVHDIDQIRRSRGNITRRQARTSSVKRDGSSPSSSKPTPSQDRRSPSMARQYSNGDLADRAPMTISLNRPNWQATGVINDLPQTSRDGGGPKYDHRRDQLRRVPVKQEMAQRQKMLEEKDDGRATELALREVLDSIKSANARVLAPHPFEFDWFGQTFPSLCLRCLSRPLAISSNLPIPSDLSWPITIPGSSQLNAIRRRLDDRLRYWRKQRGEPIRSNGEGHSEEDRSYHEHLRNAFNSYTTLPEPEQREIWQLESLRAFAHEQQEHGETHIKLQRAEQDAANLRIQLDRLNKSLQPREYILFPPSSIPIKREAVDLVSETIPSDTWDYDKLVSKWKTRIQSSRNSQQSLPAPSQIFSTPTTIPNHSNGGPSRTHTVTNGGNKQMLGHRDSDPSDSDLMDAPGDEDDEIHGQTRELSGVLDPKLRGELSGAMQGVESDSGRKDYERGNDGVNGRG